MAILSMNHMWQYLGGKNKYLLLPYFHGFCFEILSDCHYKCFQFRVSFKTICYLLKLSKKGSFEVLPIYIPASSLFTFICQGTLYAEFNGLNLFYRFVYMISELQNKTCPQSLHSLLF